MGWGRPKQRHATAAAAAAAHPNQQSPDGSEQGAGHVPLGVCQGKQCEIRTHPVSRRAAPDRVHVPASARESAAALREGGGEQKCPLRGGASGLGRIATGRLGLAILCCAGFGAGFGAGLRDRVDGAQHVVGGGRAVSSEMQDTAVTAHRVGDSRDAKAKGKIGLGMPV